MPISWALHNEPRLWQREAVEAWRRNNRRGIISVVTGGGKTAFAYLCIIDFVREAPNRRVVIIVPTLALLDQWVVGLQEDLGVTREEIGIFSGEEKAKEPRVVNIAVINTARQISATLIGETETLLVVDECHRAATPLNAQALVGGHSATLGLSATPDREYDNGLLEYLIPYLGPVIYSYNYRSAQRDEVISPFELVNVRVDLLPDEADTYKKLTRRVGFEKRRVRLGLSNEMELKRLLQRRASVASAASLRVPVAARLVENHRGSRTVVFTESVLIADKLQALLIARRHSSTVYHSDVAPAVRRDNLRLYRKGVFDILLCVRALDEGLNVPDVSVAVVASSTASKRQRIQRLGRVLRPAPGKDRATIYTLYATDQEEQRLLREAHDLEGVTSVTWRKSRLRHDGQDLR